MEKVTDKMRKQSRKSGWSALANAIVINIKDQSACPSLDNNCPDRRAKWEKENKKASRVERGGGGSTSGQ